jgi:hypothetical protein
MRNVYGILAVIGLALTPWAAAAQAQAKPSAAPAAQPADAAAATVPPDQQATKEQMVKFFEAMHLREQMQAMEKMMPAMIQRQLHAQLEQRLANLPNAAHLTPQQEAQVEALVNQYMQKTFDIYPYDEMVADMTTIYQRHISRSDVEAAIAFYSSPAGQDLLNQQPVIMKEFMPIVMQHEQEGTAELADELTQKLEALIKTFAPPAKAPAAK